MSTRKRHVEGGVHEPTEAEVDQCEFHMSMATLRDADGPYKKIPRSVKVNGRRIPKSALRKRDLCREFLRYGGKVSKRVSKELKHWTPPRKISAEERHQEKLQHQRLLDHHGSKTSSHQGPKTSHHRSPSLGRNKTSTEGKKRSSSRERDSTKKANANVEEEDFTEEQSFYRQMQNMRLHEEPSHEEFSENDERYDEGYD